MNALAAAGAPPRSAVVGTVRSPLDPSRTVAGVLFDVDGTLYRQAPLRACMAAELCTAPLRSGTRAIAHWRALRAYRQAQEQLRHQPLSPGAGRTLAEQQLAAAAAAAGASACEVAGWVDEWMVRRPLKYLSLCRARGLVDLLDVLHARGVRLGVLSDYEPREKLAALGIASYFHATVCSSDPAVNAFKPHPLPFLHACARLGLPPADVLYVGDRLDVDAAGARAAAMPCVIVGRLRVTAPPPGCVVLSSLEELRRAFDAHP
jgi:FMN phosphatase YigB (HAD superfamily)